MNRHTSPTTVAPTAAGPKCVEEVEVRGHIIDSLILPKIPDVITAGGGAFQIKNIVIGQSRADASHALLEVRALKFPLPYVQQFQET